MLRRVIGEDIDLRTVFDASDATVKIDPGQIEQMVLNLAVNARDAMPDGGCLTIETRTVQCDGSAVGLGGRHGTSVRLTIRDTGGGMTDEVKSRLFEPFFTTKPVGKGTGLGLATVYGIVHQNHGAIVVHSEVGRGAAFDIDLPYAAEELSDDQSDTSIQGDVGGTECVLIVEDERHVRLLAQRILASRGYEVLMAAESGEALALIEQHCGRLALMLTDVVMPGMNGRELAERARRRCPEVAVVYMSGYTDDAVIHHGVRHEDVRFLNKPFTPDGLLGIVRAALDAPRMDGRRSLLSQ
jgi:CheY-like chemotaxis protein